MFCCRATTGHRRLAHGLLRTGRSPGALVTRRSASVASLRQVHLAEERLVARIAMQVLEHRIAFDSGESAIALLVRALEPLERLVLLAPPGVDLGKSGRPRLALPSLSVRRAPAAIRERAPVCARPSRCQIGEKSRFRPCGRSPAPPPLCPRAAAACRDRAGHRGSRERREARTPRRS